MFFGKQYLLRVASPINIIFVYSHGKHNLLAPSLSHGKLSHFFSLPFAFSLLTSSLDFPIELSLTISLLSFLHVSLPLCNTIL